MIGRVRMSLLAWTCLGLALLPGPAWSQAQSGSLYYQVMLSDRSVHSMPEPPVTNKNIVMVTRVVTIESPLPGYEVVRTGNVALQKINPTRTVRTPMRWDGTQWAAALPLPDGISVAQQARKAAPTPLAAAGLPEPAMTDPPADAAPTPIAAPTPVAAPAAPRRGKVSDLDRALAGVAAAAAAVHRADRQLTAVQTDPNALTNLRESLSEAMQAHEKALAALTDLAKAAAIKPTVAAAPVSPAPTPPARVAPAVPAPRPLAMPQPTPAPAPMPAPMALAQVQVAPERPNTPAVATFSTDAAPADTTPPSLPQARDSYGIPGGLPQDPSKLRTAISFDGAVPLMGEAGKWNGDWNRSWRHSWGYSPMAVGSLRVVEEQPNPDYDPETPAVQTYTER